MLLAMTSPRLNATTMEREGIFLENAEVQDNKAEMATRKAI